MLAVCASFLLLKFATSVVQIPASSAPHYSTVMSDDDTSARANHASMNYTKDAYGISSLVRSSSPSNATR